MKKIMRNKIKNKVTYQWIKEVEIIRKEKNPKNKWRGILAHKWGKIWCQT